MLNAGRATKIQRSTVNSSTVSEISFQMSGHLSPFEVLFVFDNRKQCLPRAKTPFYYLYINVLFLLTQFFNLLTCFHFPAARIFWPAGEYPLSLPSSMDNGQWKIKNAAGINFQFSILNFQLTKHKFKTTKLCQQSEH